MQPPLDETVDSTDALDDNEADPAESSTQTDADSPSSTPP
jgi:hypothetical protein